MAGLLDFLNTDEGRLGLGLLGAAAPTMQPMNFAGRLAQGMDNYQGMQQQQQKGKLLDMQMQNYQSEIDARKLAEQKFAQQQAIDAQWLGLGTQQPTAGASGTAPAVSGAPGAAVASPVDGKIGELSRQYGVPKEALWADYRFNGGKKIAELINDSSKPNWMNVNGNLVNTNDNGFQGGIQGGISAGKDGQVTAWQPDGRGGLVVGAPNGALDTFKAYKDVESGLKPIKVYNPATGREEFTSERAVVAPQATPSNFPSGYAGGSRETADAGRLRILQQEMTNPDLAPGDRAALQREIDRMPASSGATPSGRFAAGPSVQEASTAAANLEYDKLTAKDQAQQRSVIMKAGFDAPAKIANYKQLGDLLSGVDGGKLTATGTNLASAMNSLGLTVDKTLPNKEAAAALGNKLALELRTTADGGGMPGSMSDSDRQFLVNMVPNAGQTTVGRKKLIDAQIAISTRQQQVANFARNYEKKHGRLDNGFFGQMQSWAEAHPLFGAQ